MPLIVFVIWFLIIFPFFVLIPYYFIQIDNSDTTFFLLTQKVYLTSLLSIIIAVTGISITFNLILDKLKLEERTKFTAKHIIKKLSKIAVKCDELVIRLIFEEFIRLNKSKHRLKKALKNQHIAYEWPILAKQDLKHSKRLITTYAYIALKKKLDKFL